MRKGFSIITAIIFMVLIGTLGTLALSLSTQNTKQTTDLYLKEQAELLAKSALKYTLLAIFENQTKSPSKCLHKINTYYPKENSIFDINITIQYIGSKDGYPNKNTYQNPIETLGAINSGKIYSCKSINNSILAGYAPQSNITTRQSNIIKHNLATKESDMTAIVDVFVTTRHKITTEPIRYHIRTIQKKPTT